MAVKNTLFKVDINVENPLKTILKYGKIPVVRKSKTGFQNYNQKKYINQHKESFNEGIPLKGCFAHIGGIQGNYISGAHYEEKLNIGYLEPDEKIFITYVSKKSKLKEFSFVTAKERFEDCMRIYSEKYSDSENNLETFGDLEDFDILTEGIIDATKVHKVLEVEIKDLYKLSKYKDDGYLRMFFPKDIFRVMLYSKNIPQDFLKVLGFPDYYNDSKIQEEFEDKIYFTSYGKLVTKEFISYYSSGCKNKSSFLIDYLEDEKNFKTWLENYKKFINHEFITTHKENLEAYLDCSFFEGNISIIFNLNSYRRKDNLKSISFILREDFICRTCTSKTIVTNDDKKDFNLKEETIFKDLKEEDLFKNNYRYYLYHATIIYDKFKSFIEKYFTINDYSTINKAKLALDLENRLSKFNYSYNDEENVLDISFDEFSLEYNFVLDDAVVKINEPDEELKFYNIENIPSKYYKIKNSVEGFYFYFKNSEIFCN